MLKNGPVNIDHGIIFTTTDSVPGMNITKVLGMAHSSSVQTKSVLSDVGANLKSVFGGSLGKYEMMIETAKKNALDAIENIARNAGGNAIVGVRFSTTNTTQFGSAEVIAYGTVVKVSS